jgi:methylated-DNA-[protein]-cysteine S-methyltransferase
MQLKVMNRRKQTANSNKKQSSIFNFQSSILSYHICTTAFGHAGILFQTDPFLLKGIFLPQSQKRTLLQRMKKSGPAKPGYTQAVLHMCEEIRTYFEGSPVKAPWELLDLDGLTPLQCAVLKAVSTVRYGEVRSYGQIAAQVGRLQACRFVGTTLSRNPFPILIPCHRIVCADGSPGGFSGGTDLKRRMLLLEK